MKNIAIKLSSFNSVTYLWSELIEKIGFDNAKKVISQASDLQKMHGKKNITMPIVFTGTAGLALISIELVRKKLIFDLKLKNAQDKAEKIKNEISNGKSFKDVANKYKLEIKGVKPFTRVLPDSSELPIPLISKIFDSNLGDINIEKRGNSEIIIAKTAEILNNLSSDEKEIKEFTKKIKDDLTIDLLAQFSEALRKKYKITINDDVIDQLN